MSILRSTPTAPHPLRGAWLAVALSPVVLVLAVGVGFAVGSTGGSWLGGALVAVIALAAPTIALLVAQRAGRDHVHGADIALAAAVVDWLIVVAVLVLGVVSPPAALVGVVVSGIVVLTTWRPGGKG